MAQLYSSVKELIHRISIVADPELAEIVGALALPAVGFESKPRPTTSFRGGDAPLPTGASWPELNGVPLNFIASFDLGRVPKVQTWEAKPSVGSLLFFAFPDDRDDFVTLNGVKGFGQVILSDGIDIIEREHPAGTTIGRRYLKATEPMWSIPPATSDTIAAALEGDNAALDSYRELGDKLWSGRLVGVDSQLLGYPEPWQDDPTSDDGVSLLAEIEDVVGSYFYTITDDDLAALNFSNVHCESQCD